MEFFLYILKHPKTKNTVYVGVSVDAYHRFYNHRSSFYKKHGFYPEIDILMIFHDERIAKKVERNLIDSLRELGNELTNSKNYNPGRMINGLRGRATAAELEIDFMMLLNQISKKTLQ